ncbi:hypothetical protein [Laspinema palackyanum]|uniref:hypothetical protein n=1 Tax=Laspinema palackyanum TaxID=3231601 RepID=UPI00345CFA6F|nr:hypothetical protein [Laspinema sp. D2c]
MNPTATEGPAPDPSPESVSWSGEHWSEEKHLLEIARSDRQFAVELLTAWIEDSKPDRKDAS